MTNREDWNEVKEEILSNDLDAAESILYRWACGKITTSDAKSSCEFYGFKIDFRQRDNNNFIDALYVPSGMYITLEI